MLWSTPLLFFCRATCKGQEEVDSLSNSNIYYLFCLLLERLARRSLVFLVRASFSEEFQADSYLDSSAKPMTFVIGSLWIFSCPCAKPRPWASRALIRARTKPPSPTSPELEKSSST